MFKTSNGRHRINTNGGWRLLMLWYEVCPVLVRFVWFSCVRHPVGILYVPLMFVRPELWTVNCLTGNRVSKTSTAYSICDRSATVLSVSYTVHIRFVCYISVTRTFVDCSLSVTCLVCMRSLRLPLRSSMPLRRLSSPDKQFMHFFCPFGIRNLYPLICDSTIKYYYAGKVGYATLSPDLLKSWPTHNFIPYLLLLISCLTVTRIFQGHGAIRDKKGLGRHCRN